MMNNIRQFFGNPSTLASLAAACTLSFALAGCGQPEDLSVVRDDSTPADSTMAFDTVILDAAADAQPTDAGPDLLDVTISGRVILGGNPCSAATRKVELVSEIRNNTASVKAVVTDSEPERICTMEYNPVFTDVQTTIRIDRRLVTVVQIENAEQMGRILTVLQLTAAREMVLFEVKVTPINAGINPDAFAWRVEARVQQGSNPCVAANNQVSFVPEQNGSRIVLRATVRSIDPDRICTMEFRPVWKKVSTEVRGFRSEIEEVIVNNVNEAGHNVRIEELLAR